MTQRSRRPWYAQLCYGAAVGLLVLLPSCADVHDAHDRGRAPLELAVERGDVATARALLDLGADPNGVRQGTRESYVMFAARRGDAAMAKLLIDHKADVYLEALVNVGPAAATMKQLLDLGADANRRAPGSKFTPLQATLLVHKDLATEPERAAESRRVVALLLEHGATVNPIEPNDFTPLATAIMSGDPELVSLLLDHGAAVHPGAGKYDPLYVVAAMQLRSDPSPSEATKLVHFEAVLELLLAHGVDINESHALAACASPGGVAILRKHGAIGNSGVDQEAEEDRVRKIAQAKRAEEEAAHASTYAVPSAQPSVRPPSNMTRPTAPPSTYEQPQTHYDDWKRANCATSGGCVR